jgi:hypothetical protein
VVLKGWQVWRVGRVEKDAIRNLCVNPIRFDWFNSMVEPCGYPTLPDLPDLPDPRERSERRRAPQLPARRAGAERRIPP